MGQFDNFNQAPPEDHKVTISGLQFHELHAADSGSSRPDFSHLLSRNSDTAAAPVAAAPVREQIATPAPAPTRSQDYAAPAPAPSSYQLVDGKDDPPPPRPSDQDSTSSQLGWYAGLGVSIGASAVAYNMFNKSVRAKELENLLSLEAVTKPETLSLVREKAEALVNDVVAKKNRIDGSC